MTLRKLGDLVKIRTGKLDANANVPSGEYPFFTCAEMPLRIDAFSYDCECVLVAGNGDLNVKYYSGKFDAYQRTYIIESLNTKTLSNKFLYFFLDSYMDNLRHQAIGGVIKYIKLNYLQDAELFLPDKKKQEKIVNMLDKSHSLIRKRRQSLAKLDQLAQSIFLDIFVYSKANQKWPEVKIEDLAANVPVAMRSGPFGSDLKHSEFVDEGVAVLGIDNVATNEFKWGERRFITEKKYQELKRYTIRPRDVLITIMATLGRTCVVPDNIPLSINTKHLAALTIDPNKASPYFISKAFLYHPDILGQLKVSEKGAIMAGLNLGIIKGIKIKIPPIDLQNVYEKRILKIREMRLKLIQSLKQVEELQKSLSQKFFS